MTLTAATGFLVSGRFEFDGSIAKPTVQAIQQMVVQIQPVDGRAMDRSMSIMPSPTGEFTTLEIPPGRYVVRMAAFDWAGLTTWAYLSSTLNGAEVGTVPIDLTADVSGVRIIMSDHANEISGTVRDAQGRPDPTAAVLIFSTDRAGWTNFGTYPRAIRNLKSTSDGAFRIPSMPPGEYYVIAVPDERTDDWMNTKFLERLAATATRFRVVAGQKTTLNVVTSVIR
jgi:hypothetical protein